ncbi:hypothetical protein JCM8547_006023 [Rhodosporidiobolus lusitaniae]
MISVRDCHAWRTILHRRTKLDNKALPLVHIGYEGDSATCRLYDSSSGCIIRAQDVRFVEHEFPLTGHANTALGRGPAIQPADLIAAPPFAINLSVTLPHAGPPLLPLLSASASSPSRRRHLRRNSTTPDPSPTRRPQRRCRRLLLTATDPRSPDPINFHDNDPFEAHLGDVEALISSVAEEIDAFGSDFALPSSDLHSHREAACKVNSEHWRCEEQGEFSSLLNDYESFHFIDRRDIPPGAKVLGVQSAPWHRLPQDVAPVAKFTSICMVALAACDRMLLHQANIDKAYLHGALEEDLYMRILEDIDSPALAGKVLKLVRALYGLKQAGCVWTHPIHASLIALSYERNRSDVCVYKRLDNGAWHYMALLKGGLKAEYGIKDLGKASFILDIQVHWRPNGPIFLSQRASLEDVLWSSRLSDGTHADDPESAVAHGLKDHVPEALFGYCNMQAVRSPMYAMLGTRPDLLHSIGILSCPAARPNASH